MPRVDAQSHLVADATRCSHLVGLDHGLGQQTQVGGRSEGWRPIAGAVLEQTQDEGHELAPESRRRIRQQPMATPGEHERVSLDDPVGRQVGRGEQAPAGRHLLLRRTRDLWVGEPTVVDAPQEPRQRRVGEALPHGRQTTRRSEDVGSGLGTGEDRPQQSEHVGLQSRDDHTLAGEPASRAQDLLERQPTEPSMDVQPAGETAGHCHRTEADMEVLVGAEEADGHRLEVELVSRRQRATTATRRVDEEVEEDLFAARGAGEAEPAPAEAGEPGSATEAAKPAATTAS